MKTFIAQQIEMTEFELACNGYPITQAGADQYAKKLWTRCPRPAKDRARRAQKARQFNGGALE